MIRTPFLLAALLAFAGGVGAQVHRGQKALERSYELDLTQVVLPAGGVGTITVTPCAGCTRIAHRATASTVYLVNGTAVPFGDFMKAVEDHRSAARRTLVAVYYDIESKGVDRVLLQTR